MEIREIKTFLYVAKLKSFSRAAEQLGYTQAAVTIQVKHLEKELGVHLFDRIGKQITLTHQGAVFYEYASQIINDITHAKEAVSDSRELTGKLCIGTIESICSSIFPALLREYHRLFPKVSINIITDSPEVLLNMVNRNVIDIVYFLDRPMHSNKWVKVLEEPEEVIFVASPENPLAAKKNLTLDDVISQPFIATEKDASYRYLLEQHLASVGKKLQPFLETGSTEFIVKQLLHNLGVSFLPAFIVQRGLDLGRLVQLDVSDYHLQVWRQILYHKDKWMTRETASFLDLAQNSPILVE